MSTTPDHDDFAPGLWPVVGGVALLAVSAAIVALSVRGCHPAPAPTPPSAMVVTAATPAPPSAAASASAHATVTITRTWRRSAWEATSGLAPSPGPSDPTSPGMDGRAPRGSDDGQETEVIQVDVGATAMATATAPAPAFLAPQAARSPVRVGVLVGTFPGTVAGFLEVGRVSLGPVPVALDLEGNFAQAGLGLVIPHGPVQVGIGLAHAYDLSPAVTPWVGAGIHASF